MRTFHRGAAVALTFKGVRIEWDHPRPTIREFYQHGRGTALSVEQYASSGNAARQRKKGPITRYGVKQ